MRENDRERRIRRTLFALRQYIVFCLLMRFWLLRHARRNSERSLCRSIKDAACAAYFCC